MRHCLYVILYHYIRVLFSRYLHNVTVIVTVSMLRSIATASGRGENKWNEKQTYTRVPRRIVCGERARRKKMHIDRKTNKHTRVMHIHYVHCTSYNMRPGWLYDIGTTTSHSTRPQVMCYILIHTHAHKNIYIFFY